MKRKAPKNTLPGRSKGTDSKPNVVSVYGVRAVAEVLRHQPERVRRVLVTADHLGKWQEALKALPPQVEVRHVSRNELDETFQTDDQHPVVHQGIALQLSPLPPRTEATLREDAQRLVEQSQPGILVALDEVQDPHNIGAVLRVAEATAAAGIIVPERRSASLGETVRKVSVGASELVPTYEISNLARVLGVLKETGWWVVGLSRGAESKSLFTDQLPERTVLVLGAEGKGIRQIIAAACDYLVAIPMYGVIDSLNVSQAATVALYSFRRQYPCNQS